LDPALTKGRPIVTATVAAADAMDAEHYVRRLLRSEGFDNMVEIVAIDLKEGE
jgi:hypothetical protein